MLIYKAKTASFPSSCLGTKTAKRDIVPTLQRGNAGYRSSGTGRWSVPHCVPTLERGNDSQAKSLRDLHAFVVNRLLNRFGYYFHRLRRLGTSEAQRNLEIIYLKMYSRFKNRSYLADADVMKTRITLFR